jgi:hypothetical protein
MGQSPPNLAIRAMSGLALLATELRTSLLVVRFGPTSDIAGANHATKKPPEGGF